MAPPTTSPRLLTETATLSLPPSVPRLMICPSFHKTAKEVGAPTSESMALFSDSPAISPLSEIQYAQLDQAQSRQGVCGPVVGVWGRVPISVWTPFLELKT